MRAYNWADLSTVRVVDLLLAGTVDNTGLTMLTRCAVIVRLGRPVNFG